MNWRCLNEPFGYCSGTPECEVQPNVTSVLSFMGGTCKLDLKTCGKYQALSDAMAGVELVKGKYRHTVVSKKKGKKGER